MFTRATSDIHLSSYDLCAGRPGSGSKPTCSILTQLGKIDNFTTSKLLVPLTPWYYTRLLQKLNLLNFRIRASEMTFKS